ncbi:MAG: alpha/beta hydrolase, partial [Pseudomonadota bacterium]
MTRKTHLAWSLTALLAVLLAGYQLEGARTGLTITDMRVGSTPATRYQLPEQRGPLVVVAHGFAGSRQLMHPFSLNLARSGYIVLAFDFEGHGRNP